MINLCLRCIKDNLNLFIVLVDLLLDIKKELKNLNKLVIRVIFRNELDKACFQHDSAYADNKVLINRTKSDKVLRDEAYNIASNPEYDGYQRGLAMVIKEV